MKKSYNLRHIVSVVFLLRVFIDNLWNIYYYFQIYNINLFINYIYLFIYYHFIFAKINNDFKNIIRKWVQVNRAFRAMSWSRELTPLYIYIYCIYILNVYLNFTKKINGVWKTLLKVYKLCIYFLSISHEHAVF